MADTGGLSMAVLQGDIRVFACLGHQSFFGKPCASVRVICPDARRRGLSSGPKAHVHAARPELRISTNGMNRATRALPDKSGWRFCGDLGGLDDGDPERLYRSP